MKYPKRLLSIVVCLCMLAFAGYHFEKVKRLTVGSSQVVVDSQEEVEEESEPRIVSKKIPVILLSTRGIIMACVVSPFTNPLLPVKKADR